jgi:thiamine-phosphate pyrophosphorylase
MSGLGPLIVVTDRQQAAAVGQDLVDVAAAAVGAGTRTILLREKDLPPAERTLLAKAIAELLAPVEGTLLVAGDARLAGAVGAAGLHLSANQPIPPIERAPEERHGRRSPGAGSEGAKARRAGGQLVVGRSCHSVDDLRCAHASGLAYATLSPIWTTTSKLGYGPPLGLSRLADAVAAVPTLPIYALGGVGPGRARECQRAGATGVAVMGEIMRAADPAAVVQAVLDDVAGTRT